MLAILQWPLLNINFRQDYFLARRQDNINIILCCSSAYGRLSETIHTIIKLVSLLIHPSTHKVSILSGPSTRLSKCIYYSGVFVLRSILRQCKYRWVYVKRFCLFQHECRKNVRRPSLLLNIVNVGRLVHTLLRVLVLLLSL